MLTPDARSADDVVPFEGVGSPGYPHAQNMFSPTNVPTIDLDKFYAATSSAGVSVHQTLMNRAYFLYHGNNSRKEWAPVPDTLLDPAFNVSAVVDPSTYAAIAAHAFQVSARYGAVKVDDALLQLAPGQARVSGLDTMGMIEVLNEPNGWWRGRQGFMKPE